MIGRISAAFLKIKLYFLLKQQFRSNALRSIFLQKYAIQVGLYSYGCFDPWRMGGPMLVGRYCSIAGTVRTALVNHPIDAITTHPVLYEAQFGVIDQDRDNQKAPLIIEDDVWIGHNAILLPGCKHVGRGAIIGAGSVVTRNVEPYTIVAGNPARFVRRRFDPDLIAALEASHWWEKSADELKALVRANPELVYHPDAEGIRRWIVELSQ